MCLGLDSIKSDVLRASAGKAHKGMADRSKFAAFRRLDVIV